MSCSSFREGWPTGGPGDHAASCAKCAAWAADQSRAAAALEHLRTRLDGVAPADHEAALRAAFRDASRRAPRPERRRWLWAAAAAAACVVAAAGLGARGRTRGAPPVRVATAPSPARMAAAARAEPAPGGVAAAPPSALTAPGPQPAAARPAATDGAPSAAEAPARAADPVEALLTGPPEELGRGVPAKLVESLGGSGSDADDRRFYPLVPGAEPAALESGQIVRVQLRPDVLEAVGLPARGAAGEPVEAEVLVGPDGVARGIRLAGPRR